MEEKLDEKFICEHCGEELEDEFDLEIFHRGCRLKAAFPGTYKKENGLLIFDLKEIGDKFNLKDKDKDESL